MNNPATTVAALLCCLLLVSTPIGFVTTASAASVGDEDRVDVCNMDPATFFDVDKQAVAEETMILHLPRWYKDVASDNVIRIEIEGIQFSPLVVYHVSVGQNWEVNVREVEDVGQLFDIDPSLTVNTDCETLTRIVNADDKQATIVEAIWNEDITYSGDGPGADAAVVTSKKLLTGNYILETREVGSGGDFLTGAYAPVTKTYEEITHIVVPWYEEVVGIKKPGGG